MKIAIILIVFIAGTGLQAQDKKAKKILDKISKSYESASNVSVDFDLVVKYPREDAVTYPSSVIQSGNKFVFKNSEQEYYGNGDDIWIYTPSQNEVEINDFEEDEAEDYFITPLDLLSQYKSGKYAYQISEDRGQSVDIEFKPGDEFSDYSKLRITVAPDTDEVKQVIAFAKDGSNITLVITSVKKNIAVDGSVFLFDASKYPGVHIEDLRLD